MFSLHDLVFKQVLLCQSVSDCLCVCINVCLLMSECTMYSIHSVCCAACSGKMCRKVCNKDREKRAGEVYVFEPAQHTFSQSARSSSSASRGAPCPPGVCGQRNKVSLYVNVQKYILQGGADRADLALSMNDKRIDLI